MKKRSLIPVLFVLFVLSAKKLPAQGAAIQPGIKSVSDSRLPKVILDKLLSFQFSDSSNTLSGETGTTKKDVTGKLDVQVTYNYTFSLKENQLSGTVLVKETITGYGTSAKQYPVDMNGILRCCKQAGNNGTICFDADDAAGIKAAEQSGCKNWYRRVKP